MFWNYTFSTTQFIYLQRELNQKRETSLCFLHKYNKKIDMDIEQRENSKKDCISHNEMLDGKNTEHWG